MTADYFRGFLLPYLPCMQVMGLPEPYIVPEQRQPDPEFPTVVFPNPEEGKGTWSMAFRTGAWLTSGLRWMRGQCTTTLPMCCHNKARVRG